MNAALLSLLLVRGRRPFLLDAQVTEVHLQARHLEWKTDDILVVGTRNDGERRQCAVQVKRTISLAEKDTECIDVFTNAWLDFQSDRIVRGKDVIGLIARPLAQKKQHGLRILLDTAHAALDAGDMARRLELPGYRDSEARKVLAISRKIIEAENSPLDDEELFQFLRHFDFPCLDLNTTGSVSEALLLSLLATLSKTSRKSCRNTVGPPSLKLAP